ncbi:hypothetical protein DAI22_05g170501 [Oryza sativa Japonica Group]|nr:hypothetical protein DAI22_05g170501 [Oryza sativa Japonica Group]
MMIWSDTRHLTPTDTSILQMLQNNKIEQVDGRNGSSAQQTCIHPPARGRQRQLQTLQDERAREPIAMQCMMLDRASSLTRHQLQNYVMRRYDRARNRPTGTYLSLDRSVAS